MHTKTAHPESNLIVLSADGTWRHDGVNFTNPNLIRLFSRSIRRIGESNQFELQVGEYKGGVLVEDTAWFITSVETNVLPWALHVSDDSIEPLAPETLCFGQLNQLYCQISHSRNRAERARFTRTAFQAIFPHFLESGALKIGSHEVMIPTSRYGAS